MSHLSSQFLLNNNIDIPIQDLWDNFKSVCSKCMDLVPIRITSKKLLRPWIMMHIKRLSRRKQPIYNKAKASNSESNWKAYHDIKRLAQHECRKSHDNCLSDLLDPDTDKNHK